MASEEERAAGNASNLKLSHKQWKKRKRKQKRQAVAQHGTEPVQSIGGTDGEEESQEERWRREVEEENDRQNAEWDRRDRLAHQLWLEKKEQEEKEKLKREETERKIREEWEERERIEREEEERREKEQTERRGKQVNWEATFLWTRMMRIEIVELFLNARTSQSCWLSIGLKDSLLKKATENEHQEWHNPLAPPNYRNHSHSSNGEILRDVNKCPFFTKTGACRFGDRCSRFHMRPDSSTIILMAGMFDSFELKKNSVDDYDTDMNLEYEDNELYHSFRDFYHDIVPEFKSVGRVINIKVCCNYEPHLRGNVYVQYKRESEAYDAFAKFNARWYGGRQLTCELVTIDKWKSAICGLFFAKRCPKGKACNFLHVFRNPGNEFWEADRDFENSSRSHRLDNTPRWQPRSERYSHRRRRSRSRSQTRESSRSRNGRHRSTRDRSRSPGSRSQSRRQSREREPSDAKGRQTRPTRSPSHHQHTPRNREHSVSANDSSKMRQHPSRSWSRSRSRDRSRSRGRSRSKGRSRSRGRSWSNSRSRSRGRDSVVRNKRSRSLSNSPDQSEPTEEKKHKKSKHKKSKKSSKKKKKKDKSQKSPSNGVVSLDHLEDGGANGEKRKEGGTDDEQDMESCSVSVTVSKENGTDTQ